jgi:predicted AlkP superfamily pyrophosphatase or phosphodiesterase
MVKRTILWLTAFGLFVPVLLLLTAGKQPVAKTEKPKLVVLVIVDQMRADHLTRFAGVFQHGLARLLREGAIFTDAHQDHSYTVTAAGYATLSTGAFPSRHGIVGNNWFDRIENKRVYCAEDTNAALLGYPNKRAASGRSPRRLLVPTFGDWLKLQSPKSKVFGVARKDRAAIYGTGLKADGAFWYNGDDGNFISSEYYDKSYPKWVEAFNQSRAVEAFYGRSWQKLMPEETYFLAREDTFATEGNGKNTAFPYAFTSESGKPDESYYDKLENSPFIEKLVFDFSRALIENEHLGEDNAPDVLVIGNSAADNIGHDFGPLSQESMDYFLRLDGYLGDFFSFLDEKIGKENYLIILSSDHGVLPLPEELARRGFDSKRIAGQEAQVVLQDALIQLSQELGVTGRVVTGIQNRALFVNYQIAAEKNISPADLDKRLVEKLTAISFIEDVFTKDELASANSNGRPYQDRFRHSYHPDRSGDLFIRLKKYYLIHGAYGTSHGSTYDYDTHVPLIFAGSGIRNMQHNAKVRTVDAASTIAAILGIEPAGEIDGRSLLEVIR